MVIRIKHITLILTLLLLSGIANEVWAYKVTYHILTLPMDNEAGNKNTIPDCNGKRAEAIRAIDNNTQVKLPDHFKSPLANKFAYFDASFINNLGKKKIYPSHAKTYNILFESKLGIGPIAPYIKVTKSEGAITAIDECTEETWTSAGDSQKAATTKTEFDAEISALGDGDYYFKICLDENSDVTEDCDIYVTYKYNPDNGIAKLDGSESYNIAVGNGFLAYNKGRNNRIAVIPKEKVSGEQLASEKFVKIDVKGTNISPWWGDNMTPRATAESYFHLLFKYEGEDPYNITIRSAFEGPEYYIELYGSSDTYSVNKYYEGSSLFAKYSSVKQSDELIIASDDNKKYKTANDKTNYTSVVDSDPMPGFYRNLGAAIWNSYAMLNNTDPNKPGYVFMGTRCVNGNGELEIPNESNKEGNNYKYYYLDVGNGNKLYYVLQTAATATSKSSSEQDMYEVYEYTFKVKTPFGNTIVATKRWSEAYLNQNLLDHIPDALKRKYVTFEGAYTSDELTTPLTTFGDADENGREIWLKYTVDEELPFEVLSSGQSFTDARWYTIRMNGDQENVNIAYLDGSGSFYTGRGSKTDLHQGENSLEAQVAFIGDPFELRIISHKASHDAEPDANRYIGCPAGTTVQTTFSAITASDICSWEIIPDNVGGSFKLRKYGSYDDPWYFGWDYLAANKPIIYTQTSASPIKVVEMAKKKYYYHIKNRGGQIAVMASASQDVGIPLKYSNIPEIIRSPFLALPGVSITFYSDEACTLPITHAPFDVITTTNKDIYVKYTGMETALASYDRVLFNKTQSFNVQLNGQYLYYEEGVIKTKPTISDEDRGVAAYQWRLEGGDPYDMTIYNAGAYGADNAKAYINTTFADNQALTFDAESIAAKFVAKQGSSDNSFEVMAAKGDGTDASESYFNIGRPADHTVKMYSNESYQTGWAQLQFVLTSTTASEVTYHLIDNDGVDLLQVKSRDDRLFFPTEYRSPLVDTYTYYASKDNAIANTGKIDAIGGNTAIYVRYTTNSLINLRKGQLYLLKYQAGDIFRQENGSDDLIDPPGKPAMYPYCNGDCNFFIYGQDEYELQQQGAASTRTRWAWYLESAKNDPYHVKVISRQQETFNGNDHQAYFRTFVQRWEGEDHVVTSLAWPGITGVQGTEYMVLGNVTTENRNFQLVTTPVDNNGDGVCDDAGEHPLYVVKSFEQYWKTYDTVKNKLLASILDEKDKGANPEGETKVPTVPADYREKLTGNRSDQYGFHSYDYWAYAKRFNGYNKDGEAKKGWEQIEHWYQTVNMGEGYFNFVPTVIEPVLILLDQHGWEIMRKPLPSSDQDPNKEQKKDALRVYDSPMVKEYAFWATAKKRSGLHQYYQLDKRIGGSTYTSTSLGELPPWGSENVVDAKGNQNDEYVTYIVKDEYAQSYDPTTKTGSKFLIQQGSHFASATNATTIKKDNDVPSAGGMSQYVISNAGNIGDEVLWILKPNADIDNEQGYLDGINTDWGSNPSAYKQDDIKNLKAAKYINDKTLGKFSFSNGFDPYNIQISSAKHTDSYFITNASGATLEDGDGSILGTYSGTPEMTLGTKPETVEGTWYDSRKLSITNATFMAVQDKDGNMQLMPRFDQAHRLRNFDKLVTPTAEAGDATKLTETYTKLLRPMVYNYHIIDNGGQESLRYQGGGDLVPQIPAHFQSPLAKDFTFYKDAACKNKITKSLVGEGLSSTAVSGNDVYVRYVYNEDADGEKILKGKWFTMKLNNMDAILSDGIKCGTDKPESVGYDDVIEDDDAAEKIWQWKFLENPMASPDPYSVCLYNRNAPDVLQPEANTRYAILPHTGYSDANRVYALAVTGSGTYTYTFLNGSGMTTSSVAVLAQDKAGDAASGFTSTSATFNAYDTQIKLIDDVKHIYTYKVYTRANTLAIETTQSFGDAQDNEFMPILPADAKSPMLNYDDFRYYYNNNVWSNPESPDTIGKNLQYMYGLYDDVIYVHYMPYNLNNTNYRVPNVKGMADGHVARGTGSNDAPLGLDGKLLYNVIWYDDNMMYKNGSTVKGEDGEALQATPSTYVWVLEGDDPYAIKIRNYDGTNNYINSTGGISTEAQTFMLIPQNDYDYGVLAVTGTKANKLTMAADGSGASVTTTESPTKFIFFGLATHKVIYHLVIANTYYNGDGGTETIPYWDGTQLTNKVVQGSTQRDLSSILNEEALNKKPGDKYQLGETMYLGGDYVTYCVDAGHISLGDKLEVPAEFYRPNVVYQFFVEGVYNNDECTPVVDNPENADVHEEYTAITALNNEYKGHELTNLGDNPGLLNRTVLVNIVYTFNGSLDTNAGADFVRSVGQNKWYTFEAKKNDGTPQLAQYTNAWGMEVKEGRGAHYTNDYLWTPVGDPYGFKMYHRYTCVNSGETNTGEPKRVMTTADFSEGREVTMGQNKEPGDDGYVADPNCIYELLADEGTAPGYFKIHPVANMLDETQYYFKITRAHEDDNPAKPEHDYIRLSATGYTEFTYGLTEEMLKPYYDRAGYVGGLKVGKMADYKAAADAGNLIEMQSIVYDTDNIVKYTPGYYRLHSPEDLETIKPVRYASGYTHNTELTGGESSNPIPMHFYEVEGSSTAFNLLKSKDGTSVDAGYTKSDATQGDIPIPAVEYDPASIFYFYQGSDSNPLSKVQTQGLYLKGTVAKGTPENTSPVERASAVMTETESAAAELYVMDIGGAIMLIHDNHTTGGRANLKYLSYDQTDADNIYDLKLTHNTHTDYAKWLMQPANRLGLRITTHSGGDGGTYGGTTYNYTTFYAPFDVLLPDTVYNEDKPEQIDKVYHATILESANSPWSPPNDLHPKSIGRYNTSGNGCPDKVVVDDKGVEHSLRGNDRFIPAGTPVLIAMHDNAGYVKVTLPNSEPNQMNSSFTSSRDETNASGVRVNASTSRTNILTGKYLEQKLVLSSSQRIYTFGLPFTGEMALNELNGDISATLPLQDNSGIGFYLNANPNRELGLSIGDWTRNNWYVYANKAYYHYTVTPAREKTRSIQYVPVNFEGYLEGDENPDIKDSSDRIVGDGCVYDLQGRKVATKQQVEDDTWRQFLRPGIYIINGKKIRL